MTLRTQFFFCNPGNTEMLRTLQETCTCLVPLLAQKAKPQHRRGTTEARQPESKALSVGEA